MLKHIQDLNGNTVIDLASNTVEYKDFYISMDDNYGHALRDEIFIRPPHSNWDFAVCGEYENGVFYFYPEFGGVFRAVALFGPKEAIELQARENLKISRLIGPAHYLNKDHFYER